MNKTLKKVIIAAIGTIVLLGLFKIAHGQTLNNFWLPSNNNLKPVVTGWGLQIPKLGSAGNPCVIVGSTGIFATSTCGGVTQPAGSNGQLQYNNNGTMAGTSSPVVGIITATSTTATSTFGNGIQLTGGCFQLPSGACAGTGGSGGSGTVTQVNTTFPILGGPFTTTGTLTFGGLSTTSNLSAGGIIYAVNSTNGLASAATSTLTATSPLTGSFTQIGSGGSVGCQTASGSQAGCLASADWTTFNNKQATISAIWPITLSGATVQWSGLSTTSALQAGTLITAANNTTGITTVSTSSLGVTAPITFSGTIGSQVGGAGGNFGCTNASSGVTGCLTGTDWNTFNGKQAAVTGSNLMPLWINSSGTVTSSSSAVFTSGSFNATTTTASQLPYATSTALTLTTLFDRLGLSGVAGYYLESTANGIQWVASTTYASPLNYSAGQVTCATCNTTNATVSSVATNNGLTGGTITTTGTIGLDISKLSPNVFTYWNGTQLQSSSSPTFNNLWATSTLLTLPSYFAGYVGLGTTTPQWPFEVSSSTFSQMTISDGASNIWSFRSSPDGNLYIGSSSPTSYATNTPSAIQVNKTGAPSLSIGTTTAASPLNIGNDSSATASSTITMGKIQIDGYNNAGARVCVEISSLNVLLVASGACTP